mgnify:CR=1 FL=1
MNTVLLALLRAYRFLLSPWVGTSCRFWPTCSEYAREAIEQHGEDGCHLLTRRCWFLAGDRRCFMAASAKNHRWHAVG